MLFTLDSLEVYQLSEKLGNDVWELVVRWQPFEKFGFGKQLTNAADSIAANIAEGYGRFFIKENIQFCFYARGSLMETKSWLVKAKYRRLIDETNVNRLLECLETIHKKLNAYIRVLRSNLKKQ
jgi:four helix bundle protein